MYRLQFIRKNAYPKKCYYKQARISNFSPAIKSNCPSNTRSCSCRAEEKESKGYNASKDQANLIKPYPHRTRNTS